MISPDVLVHHPSHIFFDLDNTLWDDKHPLIKPAWERLPYAINQVFGKLPADFDWTQYKGSTDIELVSTLVEALGDNQKSPFALIEGILGLMSKYYFENSEESIRPALFPEVNQVLATVKELKIKPGIVSGNDGYFHEIEGVDYPAVGKYKLKQAGLDEYFSDDSLHFWGGRYDARSRSDLLNKAYNTVYERLYRHDQEFVLPLFYVADSPGDLNGVLHMVDKFYDPTLRRIYPYDVLLILRQNNTSKFYRSLIDSPLFQTDHLLRSSVPKNGRHDIFADENFLEMYDPVEHGVIFGVGCLPEVEATVGDQSRTIVHIVPDLTRMFDHGGLMSRRWRYKRSLLL